MQAAIRNKAEEILISIRKQQRQRTLKLCRFEPTAAMTPQEAQLILRECLEQSQHGEFLLRFKEITNSAGINSQLYQQLSESGLLFVPLRLQPSEEVQRQCYPNILANLTAQDDCFVHRLAVYSTFWRKMSLFSSHQLLSWVNLSLVVDSHLKLRVSNYFLSFLKAGPALASESLASIAEVLYNLRCVSPEVPFSKSTEHLTQLMSLLTQHATSLNKNTILLTLKYFESMSGPQQNKARHFLEEEGTLAFVLDILSQGQHREVSILQHALRTIAHCASNHDFTQSLNSRPELLSSVFKYVGCKNAKVFGAAVEVLASALQASSPAHRNLLVAVREEVLPRMHSFFGQSVVPQLLRPALTVYSHFLQLCTDQDTLIVAAHPFSHELFQLALDLDPRQAVLVLSCLLKLLKGLESAGEKELMLALGGGLGGQVERLAFESKCQVVGGLARQVLKQMQGI